jgi:hypothetical protein
VAPGVLADGAPDAFAERGDDRVVPRGVNPLVGGPGTYHPKDQSGFQASRPRWANDRSAGLVGFVEGDGLLVGWVGGGVGGVGVLGGGGDGVGVLVAGGGLDGAWVCVGDGAFVGPPPLPGAWVGGRGVLARVGLGAGVNGAWPSAGASPSTLAGGGNDWISRPSMPRLITSVQVSAG